MNKRKKVACPLLFVKNLNGSEANLDRSLVKAAQSGRELFKYFIYQIFEAMLTLERSSREIASFEQTERQMPQP
jgi:hypothetical protein